MLTIIIIIAFAYAITMVAAVRHIIGPQPSTLNLI